MNARWHQQHRMPQNAGLSARVAWHVAHRKACGCRPVPPSILAALGERANERPVASSASKLKRPLEPMPADVRRSLAARGVTAAYRARPAYQRNDYLRWLGRAKLPATRQKRLNQMLEELERGGVYMKMKWAKTAAPARAPAVRRSAPATRKGR